MQQIIVFTQKRSLQDDDETKIILLLMTFMNILLHFAKHTHKHDLFTTFQLWEYFAGICMRRMTMTQPGKEQGEKQELLSLLTQQFDYTNNAT